MKLAIYLRVSTETQSFDSQVNEIEEYVKNKGLSISRRYEEKASGAKADREQLAQLLSDAKAKQFDTLLIYKLDRLGRSLKQVILTLESLVASGVSVISLKESIDFTSPTGKLMVHMISAFAEFERDLIRTRVKDGLLAAKAKGTSLGRPRITSADEVINLRRQGLSLRTIAKQLDISLGAVQNALKLPVLNFSSASNKNTNDFNTPKNSSTLTNLNKAE